MIGVAGAAFFAAITAGCPAVTIMSTLSRANSVASSAERSARPSVHRDSITNGAAFNPAKFAQPLGEGGEPTAPGQSRGGS